MIFKIFKTLFQDNVVSYAYQGCIYFIKNTVKKCNIVKYYYNLK